MSIFLHFHFCPCDAFSSSKFIKRSVLLGAFKSGFLLTTILWSINVRSFNTVWRRTRIYWRFAKNILLKFFMGQYLHALFFVYHLNECLRKNVLQKICRILSATEWSFSFFFGHWTDPNEGEGGENQKLGQSFEDKNFLGFPYESNFSGFKHFWSSL